MSHIIKNIAQSSCTLKTKCNKSFASSKLALASLPKRKEIRSQSNVFRAAQGFTGRRNISDSKYLLSALKNIKSIGRNLVTTRAVDDPDDLQFSETISERPNAVWRVLSCLPYLVPLMGCLAFGQEMYDSYPLLSILIIVFQPLLAAYYSNQFTPFIVFFALFLMVVRSTKLPHFLRFNALQSMLLDISVMLFGLLIQYLPFEIQFSWVGQLFNMFTFVTGFGAVAYSVYYTLQGKYCDIPVISEACYIQIQR
eukprot:CAMPEP_0196571422 /NCGR_PEP_ID=MMETSP1081-20130531/1610_1 /TAXON_ID=36882 /ORGANISM="Pyramimonas amylifera, Strain CCMP720" /LENGTH=252 /DNA_ID=CAMNT_0041888371 /DNA_START=52 /DNA_END=810 /DNA_ORIENTATION=+